MVLIDTVGMSQRDRMVAEQAAMLTRSGEVNRLLLLNAGSRGDTLDDVVRSYGGEDLAGCILTKVDEATALAPALDCIVRHGLTLSYVGNGQRVPEDLHLPNRKYLLAPRIQSRRWRDGAQPAQGRGGADLPRDAQPGARRKPCLSPATMPSSTRRPACGACSGPARAGRSRLCRGARPAVAPSCWSGQPPRWRKAVNRCW
jgi:hypothetical protein